MSEPNERDREMVNRWRRQYMAWLSPQSAEHLAEFFAEVRREAIEECAKATRSAQLPPNFQWGRDAMEQFEFGKERAALAILALTEPVETKE